jgi:ADP-ribose pyrophosphatase YjhB (NUDIX family)
MVFDDDGRVFLARRGPEARNEVGRWEFPGGTVHFGETLAAAVRREFLEEYGMSVEITGLLGVSDHLLPAEQQHWVSVSYRARWRGGEPAIREPGKCTEIGWFAPDRLPAPLSQASQATLRLSG